MNYYLFDRREPDDSDKDIFGEVMESIGVAGVLIANGDDSSFVRGGALVVVLVIVNSHLLFHSIFQIIFVKTDYNPIIYNVHK